MKLAGYAVCWGDEAEVDGHRERIARGAFQHTRSTNLRVAHDPRPAAALAWRVPVVEDDQGLRFEAALDAANPEHRRVIAAVRDGVDGCSIRYRAGRAHWQGNIEVVEQATLKEISIIVGDPAYPGSVCWLESCHGD